MDFPYDLGMTPSLAIPLADALFGKTKKAVLGTLYARPGQSWYLRELARLVGVSPAMLGKELDVLAKAGIVLDTRDGNRRRVQANPDCPIFEELRGIARKTAGLADVLRQALAELKGIDVAFVFGSIARGEERAGSDVDVCVIGEVANREVMAAMAHAEETIGRPVNALVYRADELVRKKAGGNSFVTKMLASPKLFLVGDASGID